MLITRKFQNVDQQYVHTKQIKIKLDKEEEENFKKKKRTPQWLQSVWKLTERDLRYVRTYICTTIEWYKPQQTLSQQQQEAIRWYNNWQPPLFPYDSIHIYCFCFTLRPPRSPLHTGPFLPSNPNQIKKTNQTNKRNFDKMSFTMKSKISSSLSLSLSFPPSVCPSPSYSFCNPPGPAPSRTPACFASLLRSSPHPHSLPLP